MRNRFTIYLFLALTFHCLFFGTLFFISRFWWNRNFISGEEGRSLFLSLRGSSQGSSSSKLGSHVPSPSHPTEQIEPRAFSRSISENKNSADSKKNISNNVQSHSNKDSNGGFGDTPAFSNGEGNSSTNDSEPGKGSSLMAIIRNKIERVKRYPALARVKQIEGVVDLSFSIEPSGSVETVKIVRSSGFAILDEEALAAVKRGAPFPYYSKPLSVSLKFTLKNEKE